ncbi:MAG: serine dehydratase [Gammaproteobacteria bacterium RIFCSPLOWO2_02_FULL_61_13]|nr:MAG: serine dehydratase [Gammaproteobacteria bacterium RIFCSPLOWO2_02_FULL_61_13]
MEPTLQHIRDAAVRIAPFVHRTPVLTCATLNRMTGAQLFFKCENLQKVGAFKMRGASNAIAQLDPKAAVHGVATHSSGNHGAAVALAARLMGIKAHVVMPDNAAAIKKLAVAGYGANITWCEPTIASRDEYLAAVVQRTGATVIHPYNNERIIAGQGTAGLELIEEIEHLDLLLVPVGGGGLISGCALAAKSLNPKIRVIGVEPEGADDARRSLAAGTLVPPMSPVSIADGLLAPLGEKTFAIIRRYVDDIAAVSETAIAHAMRTVWERMKIIIEPSSAVTVAAILEGKVDIPGRRCGIILSGGNVDLDRLPWKQ